MDWVVNGLNISLLDNSEKKDLYLPVLRKDLSINASAPDEDGSPLWLLYDPLKNQYFRIGHKGFMILSTWQDGVRLDKFIKKLYVKDDRLSTEDIKEFIYFLLQFKLIRNTDKDELKRLELIYNKTKKKPLKKLLINYLYFRIPIVNPDIFLSSTLKYVYFFYSAFFKRLVLTLGVIGLFLVIRQWDIFKTSLINFFNLKGLLFFGITLFFVKAVHELAHGYTAKKNGARVPSMGVALLVLYPFLYTDTTDSWRLKSGKQRLEIVLAGVKAEFSIAMIATFLWNFIDDGILKNIVFFLATTSWIASLSINITPFMRFDGYYALSDILGAENLQQRAFTLAKWKLRDVLFGQNEEPPETLSKKRTLIFLTYAYLTWIYRFFLFLGIALLVYHVAFKVLGIILFVVEVLFFLLLPVVKEMNIWWEKRDIMKINQNIILTSLFILVLPIIVFTPWQSSINIPGVLESKHNIKIFSPQSGFLEKIYVDEDKEVKTGDLLFKVSMPTLENQKRMLQIKLGYLETRSKRHVVLKSDLKDLDVIQMELAKIKTNLSAIKKQIEKGEIRAPRKGKISGIITGKERQWVSREDLLCEILPQKWRFITAYVNEKKLFRLKKGADAVFYFNSGDHKPLKAKVYKVYKTAVPYLLHLETASINGGAIPIRMVENNMLKPESGLYKVELKTKTPVINLGWRVSGNIKIKGEANSPFSNLFRYAASVFIRETGF